MKNYSFFSNSDVSNGFYDEYKVEPDLEMQEIFPFRFWSIPTPENIYKIRKSH